MTQDQDRVDCAYLDPFVAGGSNFGTMWLRATKSVGRHGRHSHDLRHYYATLLIGHGESINTAHARLGHANAAETLDTYSHL